MGNPEIKDDFLKIGYKPVLSIDVWKLEPGKPQANTGRTTRLANLQSAAAFLMDLHKLFIMQIFLCLVKI